MHLVINATEIGRQRGGNESYLAGLIAGLAELEPAIRVSLLTCDWGKALDLPPMFAQVNLGPYRRLPFLLWQQTRVLRRLEADWYVSTFFLPPLTPCRGTVLVHDLSFRAHPEYFPRFIAFYMRWLTGFAVWRSERVIALSEFTRRELERFHPRSGHKIVVVYPGIDAAFKPAYDGDAGVDDARIVRRYGLEPGYILAVGNIHPRKNLARLLDAYLGLRERRASLPQMVWVGLRRWESGSLVERARSSGVLLPGFIAQEDLPALYRQATILVYPSLYEGFGLPPVEAMACGTPVITSETTSLPEAVGKAALTVDPDSVEAISSAMARLLDDRDLRQALSQDGILHARGLDWKRTAHSLLSALDVTQENG
ncbi:MAG: glycosyltransferase family 4 protein [Anaerolineae bacterium]|nr:glycosyltransferase family 4 protein [Anaerolineae bacterium]